MVTARPSATSAPTAATTAAVASEPVELTEPCRAGTSEHDAAKAMLAAFAARVEALAADGDPKAANEALAALLAHRCFAFTAFDLKGELVADSALALKNWWKDRGGEMWLEHYLALWDDGAELRWGVVAPEMGKTWTRESHPRDPAAPLLCSVKDATCGRSTRGWALRAEQAFQRHASDKVASWVGMSPRPEPPDSRDTCDAKALALPVNEQYESWAFCMLGAAPVEAGLPLGGLRAPEKGWLVVRGRRGHHMFCDEIRAYDVATGAAYQVKSCSGLALRDDGSVDGAATDASRKPVSETGRLPVEALREAVWMALLAEHAEPAHVRSATGWALPRGMRAVRTGGMGMAGFGFSFGSGYTTLAWTFVDAGKVLASGSLQYWEDPNDAAHDHAVRLLQIAEAAYEPGCPPASLPALPIGGSAGGVSGIDADPRSLGDTHAALVGALAALRKQTRPCATR
jgi:hypothetical protein